MTFEGMAQDFYEQVSSTLQAAAEARQARDGENAEHVYVKLRKSAKGLMEDLKKARYRAKDTKNLITELEMLLTLLSANGAGRGNRGEAAGRGGREEVGYGQNPETDQQYEEQQDEEQQDQGNFEGEQGAFLT